MRRLIAGVVVAAVLSMSGAPAVPHVHAFGDHHHTEHRHGPAVHVHAEHDHGVANHRHLAHAAAPSTAVGACDPGTHAVPTPFVSVAPQPEQGPTLLPIQALAFTRPATSWRAAVSADPRAHGPPRITDAPLRAPPPLVPA